jgi:hypothetical protein
VGLIELVLGYCRTIRDGRDTYCVYRHFLSEVDELQVEIDRDLLEEPAGEDGIIGESVDVILCALDLIYQQNPRITPDEIIAIAARKCEKWKREYGQAEPPALEA